jgi:hypothetical protein
MVTRRKRQESARPQLLGRIRCIRRDDAPCTPSRNVALQLINVGPLLQFRFNAVAPSIVKMREIRLFLCACSQEV